MAITRQSFESLLAWLHPDPETAGRKYEVIRAGLIRIFVAKGFGDAEDLADEAINRVITRLPDVKEGYIGEPANYFRGVARNIIHEARRRKEIVTDAPPEPVGELRATSDLYECLLQCLEQLPHEKRELILDYHVYAGRDKIASHKLMAEELEITESALRLQAHRIRVALEKCVRERVKSLARKRKTFREHS
ncbi:MAG: hypothetical protein QOE33_2346 [Acidobacteriota bacterium]|nr:hypothetical protein [Acidobacteriota bacterium]